MFKLKIIKRPLDIYSMVFFLQLKKVYLSKNNQDTTG
jgi:hypothetical protein